MQYYTPASTKAVVEAHTQQIYPLVTGNVEKVYVDGAQTVSKGEKLFSIDARPYQYAVNKWTASVKLAQVLQWLSTWLAFVL